MSYKIIKIAGPADQRRNGRENSIGQLAVLVVMGHRTSMNFEPCSGKTRYLWDFPDQHKGHRTSMRAIRPAWIFRPAAAKQSIRERSHKPALNAPRRQQQRGSRWRWSAPCAHRAATTLWSCAPSPGRPAASPSLHLNTVTWLKWKADLGTWFQNPTITLSDRGLSVSQVGKNSSICTQNRRYIYNNICYV